MVICVNKCIIKLRRFKAHKMSILDIICAVDGWVIRLIGAAVRIIILIFTAFVTVDFATRVIVINETPFQCMCLTESLPGPTGWNVVRYEGFEGPTGLCNKESRICTTSSELDLNWNSSSEYCSSFCNVEPIYEIDWICVIQTMIWGGATLCIAVIYSINLYKCSKKNRRHSRLTDGMSDNGMSDDGMSDDGMSDEQELIQV